MKKCMLFTFISDKQILEKLQKELYDNEYNISIIINLSKNYILETDLNCKTKHIVDYAMQFNQPVRESSNKWVLEIGDIILDSGKRLIESFNYRTIPVWWFVELGLQEKAFLVIRFVEMIRYILDSDREDAFVIAGIDPLPWLRPLLVKICIQKGMKFLDIGTYDGERSLKLETTKSLKILSEVITPKEKYFAKLKIFISGIFNSVLKKIYNHIFKLKKPRIRFYPAFKKLLYPGLFMFIILKKSYNYQARSKFKEKILKFSKKSMVTAPALVIQYSKQTHEFIRKEKILTIRYSKEFIIKFRKIKIKEKIFPDGCILLLCETGAIKKRRSLINYKKSKYNPYIENIPEILTGIAGDKIPVICAYFGGSIFKSYNLMNKENSINFTDYLEKKHWEIQDKFKKEICEFASTLKNDYNLKNSLNYKGLNLEDIFLNDIVNYYQSSSDRILYLELFCDMIKKLKPSVVVMSNYEGVFRQIVASCIIENVQTVGIQQALGPYIHGLNKLEFGIRNLKHTNEFGCPVPDKIALWGDSHEKNFLSYGYTKEMLKVTGYCRLDTYVRESNTIKHSTIKKRIGISANSKVIMFTGTYRPFGIIIITLEDNYIKTIKELVKITEDYNDTYVLVKPWAGDDINTIISLVRYFGNSKFIFVQPTTEIHNSELLSITDVVVGSFSSIFGEGVLMGCNCILMSYPEEKYYDEFEFLKLLDGYVDSVESPDQVYNVVSSALRNNVKPKINKNFSDVFGPSDGFSSDRIGRLILSSIGNKSELKVIKKTNRDNSQV